MLTHHSPHQVTDFTAAEHSLNELSKTLVLGRETLLVIALAAIGIFSRLWILGARVMSHDESLHVYDSWLLATGKGFAHNPMMHGPFFV